MVPAAIETSESEKHSLKAFEPNDCIAEPMFTDFRLLHAQKAPSLMVFKLEGKEMVWSPSQ